MSEAGTTSEISRRARWALLAALIAAYLSMFPLAAGNIDLYRDVLTARGMLAGEPWPLRGPILGNAIHLGPIWYYLVAVLLAITGSWLGTMLLIGVLGALQFPLAYLLGKTLHGRRAGLITAVVLLLPNWDSFDQLFPLHPTLSATCVMAYLLCAARYWRRPRLRYLLGTALSFVLAVHAHPGALSLVWVGLAAIVLSMRSGRLPITHILLALLVAILPVIPLLFAEFAGGFSELRSAANYLADPAATGSPTQAPAVLLAIAAGGTRYWLEYFARWPGWLAWIGSLSLAAIGVVAAIGLVLDPQRRLARGFVAFSCGVLVLALLSFSALRAAIPFYMTMPLFALFAIVVGIGLANFGAARWARALRLSGALTIAFAYALAWNALAQIQSQGNWPFAFVPLFQITQPPSTHRALAFVPAYAMADSGRFLCAQPAISLHGAYARHLLHDYAIEMRLACDRSDVQLGGATIERRHWIGLSRDLLQQIGREPMQRVGPLGLLPVAQVLGAPIAIEPPLHPLYPPYRANLSELEQSYTFHVALAPGKHLAISLFAFGFAPDPQIRVSSNGAPMTALASDFVTSIYGAQASAIEAVELDVLISTRSIGEVDIVVF